MTDDRRQKKTNIRCLCRLGLLFLVLMMAGCDYARMTDDEAVNSFEAEMPAMDKRTVAVAGNRLPAGVEPGDLVNPLSMSPASVQQGRTAYGYYCVHCHGPRLDGYGTVGQSFAPTPAHLTSAQVQEQSDGELFVKITAGFKRHPPLGYTVAVEDRWAVINYLRSVAGRANQGSLQRSGVGVVTPPSSIRHPL